VRQKSRPNLSAGRRIRRPGRVNTLSLVTIFMAGKLGAAGGRVNGYPRRLFRFAGRGRQP